MNQHIFYIEKYGEISGNLNELIKNMDKKKIKIDYIDYRNHIQKIKLIEGISPREKKEINIKQLKSLKLGGSLKDHFIEHNKK